MYYTDFRAVRFPVPTCTEEIVDGCFPDWRSYLAGDFALKMMNCVLKMMKFVIKMMDFALKLMDYTL